MLWQSEPFGLRAWKQIPRRELSVAFTLICSLWVFQHVFMWCSWQKHMTRRHLVWSPGCTTAQNTAGSPGCVSVCELFSSPSATGICACVLSCCRTLLTAEHLSSCVQNNPELKWEHSLSLQPEPRTGSRVCLKDLQVDCARSWHWECVVCAATAGELL